jgi:hypothetical protein
MNRQKPHGSGASWGFERHVLKPVSMFKGQGLKPCAFKRWVSKVQLVQPRAQRVQPPTTLRARAPYPRLERHLVIRPLRAVAVQVDLF